MIVESRRRPAVPDDLADVIYSEVEASLNAIHTANSKFIINPTVWLAGTTYNPCVMNAADFISGNFQQNLRDLYGWSTEERIEDQRIDAYKEFIDTTTVRYVETREKLLRVVRDTWEENPEEEPPFTEVYHSYWRRRLFDLPAWGSSHDDLFEEEEEEVILRVGLEFETGNIASSFRSLMKLDLLFSLDKIDMGIFITSHSRADGATRIWPASNRNSSFDELENRNFREAIAFPIWEISFRPDGYSDKAPYLGRNGETYETSYTGEDEQHKGVTYEIHTRPSTAMGAPRKVLKPTG